MIEPFEYNPTRGFTLLDNESRIVQLHNLRVHYVRKGRAAIRKKTKVRCQGLALRIQRHLVWMVKRLIPEADSWFIQPISLRDTKFTYVILFIEGDKV